MDLTLWDERLDAAEQRTKVGIRLVDACQDLNIPWDIIRHVQAQDPERYQRLLGRPSPNGELLPLIVPVDPPAPVWRTKLGRDVALLRPRHLARLGDMATVDLRELLVWPPFPTPKPAGRDQRGVYWLPAHADQWLRWFADLPGLPRGAKATRATHPRHLTDTPTAERLRSV